MLALTKEAGLAIVQIENKGNVLWPTKPNAPFSAKSQHDVQLSLLQKINALLSQGTFEKYLRKLDEPVSLAMDRQDAEALLRSMTWLSGTANFFSGFGGDELCLPLEEISAYELFNQVKNIGGISGIGTSDGSFLPDGAGAIIEYLTKGIEAEVICDSAVRSIEQKTDHVCVDTERGYYYARRVILAIPRQLISSIVMTPGLPEHRLRILKDYQAGRVIKTIVQFERPWWRDYGLSGAVINLRGRFSTVNDASPADANCGVVVGFTTARAAITAATEDERIALFVEWLRSVHTISVPDPIAGRSVDWMAEPFSMGGYASRRPIGGRADAPDLFQPFDKLHFAGTETATAWRSYMEGAIESGERAATEVIRSLA